MKIFCFRHNKFRSSWSMLSEPNIYRDGYMYAEIVVLANTVEEAYEIIAAEKNWDAEEIRRLTPVVFDTDKPQVITKLVHNG